jgi:hypothetical protein
VAAEVYEPQGSARLELVSGVMLLREEDAVVDAMLKGWAKRHTCRPSSRCRTGKHSTCIAGSHPASSNKPRSSILARRAATPSRTTPSSTCGNS